MYITQLIGVQALKTGLANLLGRIEQTAELSLWIVAQTIRDEMKIAGKRPTYPIQWDSEKQKRAFFATDGFGRGIPTQRTNQTVNAWRAIRIENGSEVGNPLAHVRFISGRSQSRIHRGRWKLFHVVVQKIVSKLPASLKNRLIVTIHEQGFAVR